MNDSRDAIETQVHRKRFSVLTMALLQIIDVNRAIIKTYIYVINFIDPFSRVERTFALVTIQKDKNRRTSQLQFTKTYKSSPNFKLLNLNLYLLLFDLYPHTYAHIDVLLYALLDILFVINCLHFFCLLDFYVVYIYIHKI